MEIILVTYKSCKKHKRFNGYFPKVHLIHFVMTMSTHYKNHLFRLSRIKNIDYPEPTMSHLSDNQMYSIFVLESRSDFKNNFK